MMTALDPILLMAATAFVWIFMARQIHVLIETYWARLPRIAARELDSVVGRSVKNAIFPFRRRAAEILRSDEVLWRLRQRALFWSALSVLVPTLGFLSIGVIALIESKK